MKVELIWGRCGGESTQEMCDFSEVHGLYDFFPNSKGVRISKEVCLYPER